MTLKMINRFGLVSKDKPSVGPS